MKYKYFIIIFIFINRLFKVIIEIILCDNVIKSILTKITNYFYYIKK